MKDYNELLLTTNAAGNELTYLLDTLIKENCSLLTFNFYTPFFPSGVGLCKFILKPMGDFPDPQRILTALQRSNFRYYDGYPLLLSTDIRINDDVASFLLSDSAPDQRFSLTPMSIEDSSWTIGFGFYNRSLAEHVSRNILSIWSPDLMVNYIANVEFKDVSNLLVNHKTPATFGFGILVDQVDITPDGVHNWVSFSTRTFNPDPAVARKETIKALSSANINFSEVYFVYLTIPSSLLELKFLIEYLSEKEVMFNCVKTLPPEFGRGGSVLAISI